MVLVATPPRAFTIGVAAALFSLCLAGTSARATGLDEATALLKAGQHEQALLQVDKLLASDPKDAQTRFLKGVILTEQGDAKAAAEVFQRLTQDYPALPEPYNNLAVIYAAQGRYDQARAALEKSIRTHPSYATAYDNLGDVYSKLASEAYDRALRLDASDPGARKKLALVLELVGPAQAAPVRVASGAPPRAAPAKPTPPPATPSAPEKSPPPIATGTAPAKSPPPVAGAAASAKSLPTGVAAASPATSPPAASSTGREPPAAVASAKTASVVPSATPSPEAGALRSVKAWAEAWSAQDVDTYLAFYAPDFKPPPGVTRAEWESERRARISGPNGIKVAVRDAKFVRRDDGRAAVIFQQTYRSDRFQGRTRKTLELVRVGDDWRILEEVVMK